MSAVLVAPFVFDHAVFKGDMDGLGDFGVV